MMAFLTSPQGLFLLVLAVVSEYFGVAFGIGDGTLLSSLLLLMGYPPVEVVPAVILAQIVAGLAGSLWHHRMGNVFLDFRREMRMDTGHPAKRWLKRLGVLGYLPVSRDAKIAYILALCGVAGVTLGAFVVVSVPAYLVRAYIGLMLIGVGLLALTARRHRGRFSWNKIVLVGVVGAFNKGISGGGYGPLLAMGQIASGVEASRAVGITVLTKAFVSLWGFLAYLVMGYDVSWNLALPLVLGAVLATPLSAWTTRKMDEGVLKALMSLVVVVMGAFLLMRALF